jgi:CDGSH-type Zn-finger protein
MAHEIQIADNGPLIVRGPVQLKDGTGKAYDLSGREQFALCRCGGSKNKPFCDGSHKGGFDSKCAAP